LKRSGAENRLGGLLASAQDGDSSAYVEFLRAITPILRNLVRARRRFLQPQDIEDIVQDILLSIHAARATYDPRRPFLPWMSAIAHHRLADAGRRHARISANEVADDGTLETFAEGGANRIDEVYADREALRHAMTELPQGQRTAIEMLKLREMSLKEASAATGMSIAALKVSVHRGIKALRHALASGGKA
jgi:RNA polymerase sigma-70 factor (ECF subfamily)